jgi:hypothetical protein
MVRFNPHQCDLVLPPLPLALRRTLEGTRMQLVVCVGERSLASLALLMRRHEQPHDVHKLATVHLAARVLGVPGDELVCVWRGEVDTIKVQRAPHIQIAQPAALLPPTAKARKDIVDLAVVDERMERHCCGRRCTLRRLCPSGEVVVLAHRRVSTGARPAKTVAFKEARVTFGGRREGGGAARGLGVHADGGGGAADDGVGDGVLLMGVLGWAWRCI